MMTTTITPERSVRKAARLMDTDVEVRSAPGEGSSFSVDLPARAGGMMSR
jgi:signal transduction histidine kinase